LVYLPLRDFSIDLDFDLDLNSHILEVTLRHYSEPYSHIHYQRQNDTPTSLSAAVAPRTGKIIKNDHSILKEEKKICYKMVYYTLHLS